MYEWRGALGSALVVFLFVAGCGRQSSSGPVRTPGTAAPKIDPQAAERYRPAAPRYFSSAFIYLANNAAQQFVHFEVVDGFAALEGDMLLGPATLVPFLYGSPRRSAGEIQGAVALRDRRDLWPRGEIPYAIDSSVPAAKIEWINWAVSHLSSTPLRLRPRAGENDYVIFRNSADGSGCYSYVGHVGGAQEIQLADCGRGSVVHEILHAAGFFHEQSREDRDEYVTIMWDDIVPDFRSDFEKTGGKGENIGPYDYGSIMHYSAQAFSRTGRPTIVPRNPNVAIGQREGLSQGDRAAIQALYGGGGAGLPQVPSAPTPTPTFPIPGMNFPFPIAGLTLPTLPFPTSGFPFLTGPSTPAPVAPPAPASPISFTGNYSSSRGAMQCSENAFMVACSFQDWDASGRLDCVKDAGNVNLSCTWMTFLPRPGAGRASLRRNSTTDRNLTGTWGILQSDNDGGKWDATRQ